MGLGGFEPPTSPLSGVRSNQLSYRPQQNANPQGQLRGGVLYAGAIDLQRPRNKKLNFFKYQQMMALFSFL